MGSGFGWPHSIFVLLVRLFADAKCHYSTNVSRSVREIYMLLYERRGKSSNNRDSTADAKAQRNPILFTLTPGGKQHGLALYFVFKNERGKSMSEFDYYWEKAEFQDPVSHREHVENYKKGIHSSVFFDEQYTKEAAEELARE